ncbi:MAG: phosphomevalonate kinase [Candidatus Diapherotrites archaeon]|uniref:phosphomevalonate kinase n=1 Tax=Candidatus Iainarchaeum sp. TaxID=3101447 RepID=A0A8T3YJX4_9ARCH|nr:phosphomevalonate kinase [Candidatus Diapherotrites archaeon]
MKSVTVSAPGKLMLSGEWSVLEGAPCIVLAVDRRVYATASEAKKTTINLEDFYITTDAEIKGTKISFTNDGPRLGFTKHAIEAALEYLKGKKVKLRNFGLKTKSGISKAAVKGGEVKLGFGSSAAAVVAIASAVLKFHGIGIEKANEREALFKLGIIAHYRAQEKIGSGFDVAASAFGGALVYTRFDAQWLQKELGKKSVCKIVEEKWPLLGHRNIKLPGGFCIAVGFTGKGASTTELVKKMKKFKEEKNAEYEKIIFQIREVTESMIEAMEKGEQKELLTLVSENAALLRELGEESGNELEIAEHRKMAEIADKHYAAAKFSGAGGGDCSIAVCFGQKTADAIKKGWESNGLAPIDVKVSEDGARAER